MTEENPYRLEQEAIDLVASLVGRTIVKAEWFDASPSEQWAEHDTAHLWLDDGRVIEFGGWGHDAWGAAVADVTAQYGGSQHAD